MPGPLQDHFRMFALYNRWANKALYAAASDLSPDQLAGDRGAFFKSVLGTLNHLLVADRIWMGRLEGRSVRDMTLDTTLFAEFAALEAARAAEDRRIVERVFALSEDEMSGVLDYATLSGVPQSQPRHQVLSHLFNHQTHHRGQAHDLIGQILGRDRTPVLDLLVYQRMVAPTDRP